MRICEIRPLKGKNLRVTFEDAEPLVLDAKELERCGLREEDELPREQYEELLRGPVTKRAVKRAMDLLLVRPRTRAELTERLKGDGYPAGAVEQALLYVERFHYVDDKRYAEQYLLGMQGKKSRKAAGYDLLRRGIAPEVVESALGEQDPAEEYEMLLAAARKRLGSADRMDERVWLRTYAWLMRRGFSPSEIRRALEEIREEDRDAERETGSRAGKFSDGCS